MKSSITMAGLVLLAGCGAAERAPRRAGGFEGLADSAKMARLDSLGPRAASDPVIHRTIAIVLHDSSKAVGAKAAFWLAQVGRRSLLALIGGLRDPKPVTREVAAYGLGELGPKAISAVPPLLEALLDPDDSVSAMGEWALGKIEKRPSQLVEIVRSIRRGPRHQWLEQFDRLGQLGVGAGPAVPFLIRVLGDSDEVVAQAAGEVLLRIGAPARLAVEQATLNGDPIVKERAARIVTGFKSGL